jgi:L-fuculose-phosphate aldolase
MSDQQLRAQLADYSQRLHAQGWVANHDGNLTVRIGGGRYLATPTATSKAAVGAEDIILVDESGAKLSGRGKPFSEIGLHLTVYRNRPDVNAVVHAHPPTATGFAVAGIALDRAVLAEVLTTLGSIPIAEYATPSTAELPEAVRKYIKAHDGMLLANHGALTVGPDVMAAYYKMETIEHFAKISLVARLLGRENLITREEVDRLQGLRGTYGIKAPAPICADGSEMPGELGDQADCQIVQAPSATGTRLVADIVGGLAARADRDEDAEIRLTYRELSALIEDAVRSLR